jgi:hypothetical protein
MAQHFNGVVPMHFVYQAKYNDEVIFNIQM